MNITERTFHLLSGKKLPIFWGNLHWYDLNFLATGGRVFRFSRNWINYRKLPGGSTTKILSSDHPHSEYRHRYHRELIQSWLEAAESVKKSERVCILASGGTASGKSTAIDVLTGVASVNANGPIRIDHDLLKRALPEYQHMISLGIKEAAAYVQSESGKLGGKLFKKACQRGVQIIFEQTLEKSKMTLEYLKKDLKKHGYEVIIAATHVPESVGQKRAAKRAPLIGRYVDPAVITNIYSGVPQALFELRNKVSMIYLFDNTEENGDLALMFIKDATLGNRVVNQQLYDEYLKTVGSQFDLRL